MAKRLRVGILGAGFMGKTHGGNLAKDARVELVAVCDVQRDAAAALSGQLGVGEAGVFTDFNRLIADCPLDVLYVCLPPFAHHGEVEHAASRGIHLFLEKPMAPTPEAARDMARAIAAAGVVSQVGYHMRFKRSTERMKALLASGEAGRPTLFDARYWVNMLGSAWWRDQARSGGQVYEQLVHLYDLALYLFGAPKQVTGLLKNLCHAQPDYTIEDTSVGVIEFNNGALATITGSNCALPMHFLGDWRVVCEHALLDYQSTGQHWVTPDSASISRTAGEEITREAFIEDGDPYAAETDDFLTAILQQTPTRTPAAQGVASIELVAAMQSSASQGGVPISL